MGGRGEVRIFDDPDGVTRAAAEEFAKRAEHAVARHDRFDVVLSGGTTPRSLYALLAAQSAGQRGRIPWGQTRVFFGDERHVPPTHPDSNYRMAYETLLSHVPVPASHVFRIGGEEPHATVAAREYERRLTEAFGLPDGGIPRFDLVLLGLGADGHTASLFPGGGTLQGVKRLAAAPYVVHLGGYRVTLTLPVLNHAACVAFLVTGADKAVALRDALQGPDGIAASPARLVQPAPGDLLWFVDRAAASQLRIENPPDPT
jgi:6-phosphogluconolactonase